MNILLKALVTVFGILFRGLLQPPTTVHAYHSGDPQDANRFVNTTYIPNEAFATSPTTGYTNGTVISCPLNLGKQLVIREITIANYQAAIDATDPITLALKSVTSAGSAKATLATGISIKSTAIANKASLEVFNGLAILLPGESLEFEITVTTPDTAGFGYVLSCDVEVQAQ